MEEIRKLLTTCQYTSLRQRVAEMNEADVAALMEQLEEEEMLKMFRILPKDLAADVFSYLEVENQQMIITSLSERDAAGIIDNLMADDAVDLLEEMPANIVKKLLASARADTAANTISCTQNGPPSMAVRKAPRAPTANQMHTRPTVAASPTHRAINAASQKTLNPTVIPPFGSMVI